jgi:hypothetical protein
MRYYAFVAGNVSGPFQPEELKSILQSELLVCVEGSEGWVKAADVEELAALLMVPSIPPPRPGSGPGPIAGAAPPGMAKAAAGGAVAGSDAPPRDLAPKLRELWVICRNASDDLLREQRAKHWKAFFKTEQEIIAAEITRRGLN